MSAKITTGSFVKIRMSGSEKKLRIVEPHETDPFNGNVSWDSPIAQAILGSTAGSLVTVSLPNGNHVGVEILEVQ